MAVKQYTGINILQNTHAEWMLAAAVLPDGALIFTKDGYIKVGDGIHTYADTPILFDPNVSGSGIINNLTAVGMYTTGHVPTSETDLNDLVSPGKYITESTITNSPVAERAFVSVIAGDSEDVIVQKWQSITSPTGVARTRSFNGTTWSFWKYDEQMTQTSSTSHLTPRMGVYLNSTALTIVAGEVDISFDEWNIFTLTVDESFQLMNPPSVPVGGARIYASVDATGGHSPTFDTVYKIKSGVWVSDANTMNILDLSLAPDGTIDIDISQRAA